MEDTNNILMQFCPEVNRKWNVSLWDLIELQMKVRGREKRAGTTAGAEFINCTHRTAIHPKLSFKAPLKKK